MLVGTSEFEGLAEQMRINNNPLTMKERVKIMAKIDAMVAHDYGLEINEYRTIADSFPAFKKKPNFHNTKEIAWNSNNLKEFYGEMTDLAMKYFVELAGDKK